MNHDVTEAFNVLVGPYYALGKEPFVRWFAKHHQDNYSLGGMVRSAAELERIADLSQQGFNCYVHLNPTQPRITKRASARDALAWAFILVDIDPLDGHNPEPPVVGSAVEFVKSKIDSFHANGIVRPAIVYTGHGAHLWIRLVPLALPAGPVEHERVSAEIGHSVRTFLRSLPVPPGFRIDALGDLARIARLPGSINHRTGRPAQMMAWGQPSSSFGPLVRKAFPVPDDFAVVSTIPGRQDLEWQDVKSDLPMRAQMFIDLGADRGTRHESAWQCCKSLHEAGVSIGSAFSALLHGNLAIAQADRLTIRDLHTIVQQVYKRALTLDRE